MVHSVKMGEGVRKGGRLCVCACMLCGRESRIFSFWILFQPLLKVSPIKGFLGEGPTKILININNAAEGSDLRPTPHPNTFCTIPEVWLLQTQNI